MTPPKTAGATDAAPRWATAALVLADGTVFWGKGVGAAGHAVGEVCFNTSMTGYQEIITDPSYAGQIITALRKSMHLLWRCKKIFTIRD